MLVDDDPAAREATCDILSTPGHVVVQAASAEDALQAFADERFDAVLTDITLTGMSGIELASKLVEMRYEGAIVFVSGCEPPVISDTRYIHESLPKPYSIEQLQQVIDRVCQAAAERAGRP
ncbi:two-component regulatory system sensor kinase [Caballeronia choica]|uniref:Two-component regulatory system sensor kinase n=1 Tax=Caballeronia choica TaxID=326476 RepID=A0A158IR69_9BURK|nr:response regulator [Caballeronia choica]SAL58560.1 two-component regulatory system sensor kinase [Caballeronia choica]